MNSLNSTSTTYHTCLQEYETNARVSVQEPHNKEKELNAYYSLAKLCTLSSTATHDFIFKSIKEKMAGNTDVTSLYREYRNLCFYQRSLNFAHASNVEKIAKELGQYTYTTASAAHLFRNQSLNRQYINLKPNDELGLIPFLEFRRIAANQGAKDPTIFPRSISKPSLGSRQSNTSNNTPTTPATPTMNEFPSILAYESSITSMPSGSSSNRTTPFATTPEPLNRRPSTASPISPIAETSDDLSRSFAELHCITNAQPIHFSTKEMPSIFARTTSNSSSNSLTTEDSNRVTSPASSTTSMSPTIPTPSSIPYQQTSSSPTAPSTSSPLQNNQNSYFRPITPPKTPEKPKRTLKQRSPLRPSAFRTPTKKPQ